MVRMSAGVDEHVAHAQARTVGGELDRVDFAAPLRVDGGGGGCRPTDIV